MKTFKDNKDREWTVEVNVSTVKRVRDVAQIDLLGVLDGSLLETLTRDPITLCNCIYAVCKPQADKAGISDEEFGASMAGDAIDDATAALLDEIVSFSPNPRDRAALGKVIATTRNAMEKARDVVQSRLESGALDEAVQKAIDKAERELEAPGLSSGDARASSASTPPS